MIDVFRLTFVPDAARAVHVAWPFHHLQRDSGEAGTSSLARPLNESWPDFPTQPHHKTTTLLTPSSELSPYHC